MFALRAFLHQALPAVWQRRGWAARLLWPLSRLYAWGWRRHQRQAAQAPAPRLPVPVLVIGNVIAGGAGKTPTCIAVVQHFQRQGLRVGVLSRGYGRQATAPACLEVDGSTPAEHAGDEPLLIHRHTGAPVVVCAQRLQGARQLLQWHPDTQLLVCDDGLQHLALPRDGEICVMDERGIGNGWLLPAGPLREPWPRRSTILLQIASPYTAPADTSQRTPATLPIPPGQAACHARRSLAEHALRADGQRHALADWAQAGQAVTALAGIAQPERFFSMLRAAGLQVASSAALPDHASSAELLQHAQCLLAQGLPVLCTEKDAVKLWPHLSQRPQAPQSPQLWAVPLALQAEPAFFTALNDWWQAQQTLRHITANKERPS
ncbi:MAG: tetraacyldisaccharide 4'-kinase [Brachymonas sp.]|nr:tetraacyldisaccharide 4'-kinase [Brachymonas sp.]